MLLALFAVSQSHLAHAEVPASQSTNDAIEIEGDQLQLRIDRQLRATGNAKLRKNDQQITGDDIRYDMQNDELQVDGNAVIRLGQTKISGPQLRMRLSESIGEMRDVSIEINSAPPAPSTPNNSALLNDDAILVSDPKRYTEDNVGEDEPTGGFRVDHLRVTAKQVLFEGQDRKRLKQASYTSCAANVDDWYIKSSDLALNDYTRIAEAKHAYIEFKGVPILYTPLMNFSYNNQRKTGLLAPLVGRTSRSGFEVLTPYYINISPEMDATLATRYLSLRGLQYQGELRYLGEQYSGINNVEYLDNDNLTNEQRYYVKLSHNQRFGDRWSAGYNIEKVSDDRYFSEMATRIVVTSRVNLPQRAFVNYADEHLTFNGLIEKSQNLNNLSFLYQRLPQLNMTYQNEWNGIIAQSTAQYTYFDRLPEAGVVPTGSRFVVNPALSYPFKTSYGFITPKIGLHASLYSLNDNTPAGFNQQFNHLTRTLPIASLDTGMFFDRESTLFDTRYTNTLEPRIFYVYAPFRDQSKFPVFDTSLATLNQYSLFRENQFFGEDRINNANQVSVAVTSRLIETDSGIERLSATLGQRFNFENTKVSLPFTNDNNRRNSDIVAGFTARLSRNLNLDTFYQYNPDRGNLERNNVLVRYNPEPGKALSVGYRYTLDVLEQVDASAQWPFGMGWYGIGRVNYSIRDRNAVQMLAGLEYDASCWQARVVMQQVQTATANSNNAIFFQLELGGLTSIGANPLNVIRRNIPSYMRTEDIPSLYREQNLQ